MPHPFDATLKDMVQRHPGDFEQIFRLRGPGEPRVLNVDLSVVSAATDIALAHGNPPEVVYDLNFQASRDASLVARVLLYQAL
jgi:hypothetical protein